MVVNRMRVPPVSGGLVVLLAILTPASSRSQPAMAQEVAVDRLFREWTDSESPGAAVAVVKNGRIVVSRSYGLANLEHQVAVTPATRFDIGSIAKQFTAFAVAMLLEQGRLSLRDDVREYIPELKIQETIRIEHLLNHTSGLRDEFNLLTMQGYGVDDAITFEHSLRVIANQEELLFKPGERWEYCNSGYTLLAEIISRATGQSFADWMRENVFKPLGMHYTIFPRDVGTVIEHRASSYTVGANSWRRAVVSKSSLGCSNLFSTAEDLARWAINFDDARVGGRAVIDRMSQGGVLEDGTETDYAYGQFVEDYRGVRAFSHGGGIGGYRGALIRFPGQGLAVAVLANADHFRAMTLAKEVADLFLEHVGQQPTVGVDAEPVEEETAVTMDVADIVGDYRLDSTGKVLEVVFEDGVFWLKNLASGGQPLPLSRLVGNDFIVNGLGLRLSFVPNEDGVANRMILHVGDPPQNATRVSEVEVTDQELGELAGIYMSRELMVIYSLEARDGMLVAHHSRLPAGKLIATGPREFSGDKAWLRVIRFELDEDGRSLGFRADAAYAKDVYFERIR